MTAALGLNAVSLDDKLHSHLSRRHKYTPAQPAVDLASSWWRRPSRGMERTELPRGDGEPLASAEPFDGSPPTDPLERPSGPPDDAA